MYRKTCDYLHKQKLISSFIQFHFPKKKFKRQDLVQNLIKKQGLQSKIQSILTDCTYLWLQIYNKNTDFMLLRFSKQFIP
jgi:hypothetical protein